jgi:hypothetical protein
MKYVILEVQISEKSGPSRGSSLMIILYLAYAIRFLAEAVFISFGKAILAAEKIATFIMQGARTTG